MVPSELEENIVKTVAWFSLFEYPLTAFEIWKWLGVKSSLAEVEMVLRESVWLRGRLTFQDGFFILGGRSAEVAVAIHQERFLDAARKFKKLGRAAKFFSLFQFVRAVFACNNLAWHNTGPESDIDLFIVVAPGTIWLSRLLLVTPFRLLSRRPEQTNTDPFCFSFFITTDNLSLEKICLPEGDPYMAYWLASLVLIFDRDDIQKQVWVENEWVSKFLPNIDWDRKPTIRLRPPSLGLRWTGWAMADTIVVILSSLLTKPFEKLAKFFQLKFLPKTIKVSANLDSRVIVSDTILKFHLNDRRAHFREEWNKLYEALGAG